MRVSNMKLSEHLSLSEMIYSDTANKKGIVNYPTETQIGNLKRFALEVFEPLRAMVGVPIFISSGFRCHDLEIAVSGKAYGQHMTGNAADMLAQGMTAEKLFKMIVGQNAFKFDQVILERANGGEWVHLSGGVDKPRGEAWIAHHIAGNQFSYERYREEPVDKAKAIEVKAENAKMA